MSNKLDLSYFYNVKARFPAAPGTIVFISATSENVDDLIAQVFTRANFSDYHKLLETHGESSRAYFVVGRLDEDDYTFFYACKEFLRREYYLTGELSEFSLDPFKKLELNLDLMKNEMGKLKKILSRNSQAS